MHTGGAVKSRSKLNGEGGRKIRKIVKCLYGRLFEFYIIDFLEDYVRFDSIVA